MFEIFDFASYFFFSFSCFCATLTSRLPATFDYVVYLFRFNFSIVIFFYFCGILKTFDFAF